MINHFFDLLSLFFWLSIWLSSIIGCGFLVKKIIGLDSSSYFSNAWIGLIIGVVFSETFNFWIPIDWKASLIFLILGTIGFLTSIKNNSFLQFSAFKKILQANPFISFSGFVMLLVFGSLALTTPAVWDSGLYHFQSIRWLNEYPIVPGLANLHGRLGFNQSYFSFIALLNFYPFFNKGYAIGSLLLLVITCGTLFNARFKDVKGGWWLNFWILVCIIGASKYASSPSPDQAISLIESSIFILLIKVYLHESKIKNQHTSDVAMIFLLSCLAVTVKLSSAVFALMSVLLVLPAVSKTFSQNRRIYLCSLLLGSYLIGVHCLRGVFNSGLPFYPSTIGAIWDLDWAVTYSQAKSEADWIYSWARMPNKNPIEVLGSWSWFPAWKETLLGEHWLYVYGCLIFAGLNSMIFLLNQKKQLVESKLFILYMPLLTGILFWFFTAPDWRFLGAIPQLFIAFSGFIFIRYCITSVIIHHTERLPAYLIPLFLSISLLFLMTKLLDLKNLPISGWHQVPIIETSARLNISGLKILIPILEQEQCWDSQLPCTPYFSDVIKLRDSNQEAKGLREGFSIKK